MLTPQCLFGTTDPCDRQCAISDISRLTTYDIRINIKKVISLHKIWTFFYVCLSFY